MAPHRGSVNIYMIQSKRAEPATDARALCNEVRGAESVARLRGTPSLVKPSAGADNLGDGGVDLDGDPLGVPGRNRRS